MPAIPSSGRLRLAAILLIAFLGVGAWLWWRGLRTESTLEQLLGALPDDQAVVAYIDVPALRRAPKLGPWLDAKLAEQNDSLPLAAGVRGVSVAVGENAIYLATALDLSEAAAVSYLAQRRAGCTQPLDQAVCTTPSASGGALSMRLLEDNLLTIAHSADPAAADRLGAGSQPAESDLVAAREALADGALLWAGLDPRRLDEVMRDPPEGWINLSLVARALGPAESAWVSARETGDGIVVLLRAACADGPAAAELSAVLGALNKMAGGLLASAGDNAPWKQAVDSFQVETEGVAVIAVWTLPTEVLDVN